jgi:hypothetical protein
MPSASSRSSDNALRNVTFPATSSAPIRWKHAGGEIRPAAHIDDSSASFDTIESMPIDAQEPLIEEVAFTLELDGPKNAAKSKVQTATQVQATTSTSPSTKSDAPTTKSAKSILTSRRPSSPRAASVLSSPIQRPQAKAKLSPVQSEPLLTPADDSDEVEQVLTLDDDPPPRLEKPLAPVPKPNARSLVKPDVRMKAPKPATQAGPPVPAADPEDLAPLPPQTLVQRPTPEPVATQPRAQLGDPSDRVLPPVGPLPKKKKCTNPNDRDCCADEDMCTDRLARIKADRLSEYGLDRLDITPLYKPDDETPEQRQATAERMAQQFKLAGKRDWSNRQGRPLASGQLVDLELGKAIIRTDSGEEKQLRLRELSDDDLCFLAAWYSLPTECTLGDEQYAGRHFLASTMTFKASGLCHKPLYFEETQLERYGHSVGPMQPFVSGAHFFVNLAALPYNMGIHPPNECQYALGYYRPGSCAPWMIPPVPLSARGAASATGFYTGLNFLLP